MYRTPIPLLPFSQFNDIIITVGVGHCGARVWTSPYPFIYVCCLLVCLAFYVPITHLFQTLHSGCKIPLILFLAMSDNLSCPPPPPPPAPSGGFHPPAQVGALCSLGFLCSCCSGPAFPPSLCSSPVSWTPCLALSRFSPLF